VNLYVYFACVSATTLALTGSVGCAYGSPSGLDSSHLFSKDGGTQADATPHDSGKPPPPDAGSDDSGDRQDTSTTTTCTLSLGTGLPACDTCLANDCCSEDTACGNDPDCINFIDCVNYCFPMDGGAPDQNCINDCSVQYPNGSNELSNLDMCMQNSCMTACQ
jgi:hypothetical protein